MSEPLLTDFSLGLLLVTIVLGVYLKYFSRPLPLVHPLLLGKQSDVAQTRNSGESGIYRSWATGQGSPVSTKQLRAGWKGEGRWVDDREGSSPLRSFHFLFQLSLRPANALRTVANILDMSCPTRYIYGTFVSLESLLQRRGRTRRKRGGEGRASLS